MFLVSLLVSFAAALPAQDFSELKLEKVAAGLVFSEGPAWSPKDNFLVFCDVPNQRMAKFVPGKGVSEFRDNTNGAIGNAYDEKGRLYTCETRGRRVIRTDVPGKNETTGKVEVLADKWEGKKLNAPNDIVVRKDNHVYFTDPAFGSQVDSRELDFYGIYHITPKGELELVAKWQTRPNGIALSANGRTLYVSNSDERNIRGFDLDRNGKASNEHIVFSKIEGIPGGLRLDEKGNFYIAAKGLMIFSPQGKLLHHIEMAETPSNCAFGDPDYQTLYITARSSVYRVRLTVKGAVQH